MDKQKMEKLEERRRQEDQIFNKLLIWFAGAVVYEMIAIFLKRFFINYNQMSVAAVKFSMYIGTALGILRYVAPVLMAAAFVWGVVRYRKQKSVVLPGALTLVGGALSFTALLAYHYRAMGVSILGAVAPAVAVLAIIFFLYQKEFFYNAVLSGMGIAAMWVYRKVYPAHPKMVLVGFVTVCVLLIVAVFVAWKLSRNDGRFGKVQVMEREANYLLSYVTAGISLLAMVLALAVGATVAYYAIFALIAWLFFMAVYYTVRMM